MSHSHKALLLSLVVAVLAMPAGAQTPTDSTVKDSTAPAAKKSRFGGLMNKAKAVAGNKAVQGAVKGAATNVACNAVPGAAIAAAATGNTTCQNTLMGGLINKGVAGTAAAMAGGVASGAAANAASKLTGVKGAAAAGAIGAVTGGNVSTGGLKGAAAAMAGQKVSGLGQAAAAAAAAKMMGKGGGAANAASMAAAQAAAARMMPNGGAMPTGTNVNAADMAAAMAAMNAMGGAMGTVATGGKKVETVDFRELKSMLPASLGGLKRTDATGEKSAAMGMQISSAQGSYSSDDGKSVTVKIADIGSLSGIAGMAAYAWASTEVDREGDNEYEKTTKFKGYKALEKYNKQSHSGELSVLVGSRFVVEVEGSNVDMNALKAALSAVDLGKLDHMKGKGVK